MGSVAFGDANAFAQFLAPFLRFSASHDVVGSGADDDDIEVVVFVDWRLLHRFVCRVTNGAVGNGSIVSGGCACGDGVSEAVLSLEELGSSLASCR